MFIVELPAPLPSAPMELTRFGGWLGHVPTMELDGRTPTSRELHARIASFWLAAQTVLYIGAAETSIAAGAIAGRGVTCVKYGLKFGHSTDEDDPRLSPGA